MVHLFARSCAATLHEDRSIWNVNIKEMHFSVGSFDLSLVGEDDMAVVHVTLVWTNFLHYQIMV